MSSSVLFGKRPCRAHEIAYSYIFLLRRLSFIGADGCEDRELGVK